MPDSRVVRLGRLYPKSLVKAPTKTVLVPRPGMGVQALRDEALLEWARGVIDSVLDPNDSKEPSS